MHKIILDRSIFHGEKFNKLMGSKLSYLVKRNKLKLFFTPIFLEETFNYLLTDKNTFQDQWNFLISINKTKWFENAEKIVAIELGNKSKEHGYYLKPINDINKIIGGCSNFINLQTPPKEFDDTLDEIKKVREFRIQHRQTRLILRNSVPPGNYNLDQYFEENVDWFIENGLMKYHTDSLDYLKNWRTNRRIYKFTNSYIKAWFATILLPVLNKSMAVDENDRADAEQLAFLLWVDIIVSDDTKFMKKCFELLYLGTGKKFMTLREFLIFLESRN
jgi:hypothetical protein